MKLLFTAHELPVDHGQRIALETNLISDTYEEAPVRHLENHESFLVCPGKQPVKIGANYPVSIHIYFHNFVRRTNKNHRTQQHEGDYGDIYLHITDEGFRDNYDNENNQQNNRNNARKLIKGGKNAINDQSENDNKSTDAEMEINLI